MEHGATGYLDVDREGTMELDDYAARWLDMLQEIVQPFRRELSVDRLRNVVWFQGSEIPITCGRRSNGGILSLPIVDLTLIESESFCKLAPHTFGHYCPPFSDTNAQSRVCVDICLSAKHRPDFAKRVYEVQMSDANIDRTINDNATRESELLHATTANEVHGYDLSLVGELTPRLVLAGTVRIDQCFHRKLGADGDANVHIEHCSR